MPWLIQELGWKGGYFLYLFMKNNGLEDVMFDQIIYLNNNQAKQMKRLYDLTTSDIILVTFI